ncbi:MAG: hypothetical protein KYX61_14695, partial [Gammaproteobacteria bacterium]|nr:hypothetical protein [Gammaproteobacteria bacterium]
MTGDKAGWYRARILIDPTDSRRPGGRKSRHPPGALLMESDEMVFQRASSRYDGPTLEADVLDFWRENQVFEKT